MLSSSMFTQAFCNIQCSLAGNNTAGQNENSLNFHLFCFVLHYPPRTWLLWLPLPASVQDPYELVDLCRVPQNLSSSWPSAVSPQWHLYCISLKCTHWCCLHCPKTDSQNTSLNKIQLWQHRFSSWSIHYIHNPFLPRLMPHRYNSARHLLTLMPFLLFFTVLLMCSLQIVQSKV